MYSGQQKLNRRNLNVGRLTFNRGYAVALQQGNSVDRIIEIEWVIQHQDGHIVPDYIAFIR